MSADESPIPDLVARSGAVQTLLLSTETIERFLDELASLAAGITQPPASCGITMRRDGDPFTVSTSDGRAALVDETQYETGDGPCLESLRTGTVVEVADQRADVRWGTYAEKAVEHGVRCSLSIPLVVDGVTRGALNVYGYERAHAFDGLKRRDAEVFAAQASTALTLMMRQVAQAELTEQFEEALSSRTVIDQALGILMGQQRCTAEEAFALLRTRSQHSNRKLRLVAADLVARVAAEPSPDPTGMDQARSSDQ